MARAGDFSLGAALYPGAQPAAGYAQPGQHAPDSWLADFTEQAGGEALGGLCSASSATQSLVFRNAPTAQFTLSLDSYVGQAEWKQRLQAAEKGLRRRGAVLPTAAVLQIGDSGVEADSLDAIAPALQNAGAGVTALTVEYPRELHHYWYELAGEDQAAHRRLLQNVATALPNLRSLTLRECVCPLPPPTVFPLLADLSVTGLFAGDEIDDALEFSIAKLLRQVTTFTCVENYDGFKPAWGFLFDAAGSQHATLAAFQHARRNDNLGPLTPLPLTTLTVPQLDEFVIEPLLRHAPALQRLTVDGVELGDDYRDRVWGVRQLCTTQGSLCVDVLFGLPRNADHVVQIGGVTKLSISVHELEGTDYLRFNEWQFEDVCLVQLQGARTRDPAAIHTAVARLAHLQAPCNEAIAWDGCDWTPALATLLADAMRGASPGLRFAVDMRHAYKAERCALTNEQLGMVLGMGPIRRLSVNWLDLQSNQHAAAAWPWDRLVVDCEGADGRRPMDIAMLLRLPDPATCSVPGHTPVIKCPYIDIGVLTEADAARLVGRLGQVRWEDFSDTSLSVSVLSGGDLTRQLSVVKAMRVEDEDSYMVIHMPREPATTAHTLATLLTSAASRVVCSAVTIEPLTKAVRDQARLWPQTFNPDDWGLTVQCTTFSVQELTMEDSELLTSVLRCVKLIGCTTFLPSWASGPSDISVEAACAQLSVLKAVTRAEGDPKATLTIPQCLLASDAMHGLRGLPEWCGCVYMSQCTFEEDRAAEYTQLAEHIPVSVTRWVLGAVPSAVVQSICDGINQRRQGLGLGPVTVQADSSEFFGVEEGEHVKLEHWHVY